MLIIIEETSYLYCRNKRKPIEKLKENNKSRNTRINMQNSKLEKKLWTEKNFIMWKSITITQKSFLDPNYKSNLSALYNSHNWVNILGLKCFKLRYGLKPNAYTLFYSVWSSSLSWNFQCGTTAVIFCQNSISYLWNRL